jgi:ketosteroid isomerase-like protein
VSVTRRIAEAFSGHRFRQVYESLADDVRWTTVGGGTVVGKQAVIEVCESTLTELARTRTEFLRRVVMADDEAAAVDVVARYTDADGGVSLVSSCDIYEFANSALTAITSYAVELDPEPPQA